MSKRNSDEASLFDDAGSSPGQDQLLSEKISSEEKVEEVVYDKGYAWVIVVAVFLINFGTWGMNSGFAIYFSYYLNNDTFHGAAKLDYAAIGGLAFGAALLFAPIINFIQGKIGTRPTIIIGNCFQFTSLMLASFTTKLWQLYLTQGIMQSVGLAMISLPGLTILPQFFKKHRVLAGGLATAGSGAGGLVFNLGMQKVVETKSVFWALRVQSIISFVLVWVAIILFRSRSKYHQIQFTYFDKECISNPGYALFLVYVTFCMYGYVIVLYTLANFTTSLGYSAYQGSIASAMIQVGSFFGRPLAGMMADRVGANTVAFVAYFLSAIFCLAMWIPARNYATVIAFCVIIGAIMGSIWGTAAPMLARLVGLKKMNVAFSMLWIPLGASGIVAPVIGVALVKKGPLVPSSYVYCSLFAGLSFLVCSVALFVLRGYLVARDEIMNLEKGRQDHDSSNALAVKVPWSHIPAACFKFGGGLHV